MPKIFLLLFLPFSLLAQNKYDVVSMQGFLRTKDTANAKMRNLLDQDSLNTNIKMVCGLSSYLLAEYDGKYFEINKAYNGLAKADSTMFFNMPESYLYKANRAIDSLKSASNKQQPVEELFGKELMNLPGRIWTPTSTRYYEKTLKLKWAPGKIPDEMYSIHVYNARGEQIIWERLKATEFQLPTKDFWYDRCYFWKVVYENEAFSTDSFCIYRMNIHEGSIAHLKEIEFHDSLNIKTSSFHNLMLAQYFEENGFHYKAQEHYIKAILLSENGEDYRRLFYNFLDRRTSYSFD